MEAGDSRLVWNTKTKFIETFVREEMLNTLLVNYSHPIQITENCIYVHLLCCQSLSLDMELPLVKKNQVCSNKGPYPYPGEMHVHTNKQNFIDVVSIFSTELLCQFKPLDQAFKGKVCVNWRGNPFCKGM